MAAEHRELPVSRRQFVQSAGVVGLGLLAGCGRLPAPTSPPARAPRIGTLSSAENAGSMDYLLQGLQELGWLNVLIESRSAAGQPARMHEPAAELVSLPVDLVMTTGSRTAEAARAATTAIPIVMVYPGDPVAAGLVASLARPGANVTGLAELAAQLTPKRLELLKETAPHVTRVAVPHHPDVLPGRPQSEDPLYLAAQALNVQLLSLPVRSPRDLDVALEAATQAGAEAVLWSSFRLPGIRTPEYRSRLVVLAAQYSLPTIRGWSDWAQAGVLMAYGANFPAQVVRAATYIDKILKGAHPSDLPVEQPREFDFVINLRTAQALGLTIPPHVLLQATEVIQ
jgi:putative tryptophan/tyrosine transport system substrate-binding protein